MNLNAILNDPAQQRRRYFSVTEANRALVLVGRIVADIVDAYQYLLDLQELVEAARESAPARQIEAVHRQVMLIVDKLHGYLRELDELGVELEELSLGIVDFPAMAAGREVRLCWQHGEKAVQHWHEVGATAAARRPIDALGVRAGSSAPAP